MPNWCCQNVVLTGERSELQKLSDTINSLPSREDLKENGFGKFWIWNLLGALGFEYSNNYGRGIIHPDPEAYPTLCCPKPSGEERTEVEESGSVGPILRFSVISAWEPCDELWDKLNEALPSVGLIAHKETDEFGNFHSFNDPMGFFGLSKYVAELADHDDIEEDDEQTFLQKICDFLDIPVMKSIGELNEYVCDKEPDNIYALYKWEEK